MEKMNKKKKPFTLQVTFKHYRGSMVTAGIDFKPYFIGDRWVHVADKSAPVLAEIVFKQGNTVFKYVLNRLFDKLDISDIKVVYLNKEN